MSVAVGGVLAVGILYAIICRYFEAGIPCLFHRFTGLLCPGCGVSRMCLCLMSFDIAGAFLANPVLFLLMPVLVAVIADCAVRYVREGYPYPRGWSSVAVGVMCAVMAVWGILRNVI